MAKLQCLWNLLSFQLIAQKRCSKMKSNSWLLQRNCRKYSHLLDQWQLSDHHLKYLVKYEQQLRAETKQLLSIQVGLIIQLEWRKMNSFYQDVTNFATDAWTNICQALRTKNTVAIIRIVHNKDSKNWKLFHSQLKTDYEESASARSFYCSKKFIL